jgi:hypothetical protein
MMTVRISVVVLAVTALSLYVADRAAGASTLRTTLIPGAVVGCDPTIDPEYGGLTDLATGDVTLSGYACDGVALYARPAAVRLGLARRWRLAKDPDWYVGVGVLVALHEAAHRRGIVDETDAECAAVAAATPLLDRWQRAYALRFDAGLPANYHAHAC